jgi:hypothetical protein
VGSCHNRFFLIDGTFAPIFVFLSATCTWFAKGKACCTSALVRCCWSLWCCHALPNSCPLASTLRATFVKEMVCEFFVYCKLLQLLAFKPVCFGYLLPSFSLWCAYWNEIIFRIHYNIVWFCQQNAWSIFVSWLGFRFLCFYHFYLFHWIYFYLVKDFRQRSVWNLYERVLQSELVVHTHQLVIWHVNVTTLF